MFYELNVEGAPLGEHSLAGSLFRKYGGPVDLKKGDKIVISGMLSQYDSLVKESIYSGGFSVFLQDIHHLVMKGVEVVFMD